MLRSIVSLQHVNPGFQPNGVMTFGIMLPNTKYPTPEKALPFVRQALQQIRAVPGVESAAAVNCVPLSTIDQQSENIGDRAAKLALKLIGSKTQPKPSTVLLRPRLIVRESSARR